MRDFEQMAVPGEQTSPLGRFPETGQGTSFKSATESNDRSNPSFPEVSCFPHAFRLLDEHLGILREESLDLGGKTATGVLFGCFGLKKMALVYLVV